MRNGAEIKVGAVVLLAIVLAVLFAVYVMGFRARANLYEMCVTFDNAQGLLPGDPVMLAGVKIGQVKSVKVNPGLKADVHLTIDRSQSGPLYDNYEFRVSNSGLIQQRMVEVIPPAAGRPRGAEIRPNECVKGTTTADLTSLLAQSGSLVANLNRTVTTLNSTLANPKVLANITSSLEDLAAASDAAARAAQLAASIAEQTQPEVLATLRNVQSATADVKSATSALRAQIVRSNVIPNLDAITAETKRMSANLADVTADVKDITHNPEVKRDLVGTLDDLRASAASVRQIAADMTVVSGKLKEAAPVIPQAASEVGKIAQTTAAIRGLKAPQINASFDIVHSPKASRTFSSGRLDFTTQSGQLLRLGLDDIGQKSEVDVQLGERRGLRTLRYGLIRSQLGVGIDTPMLRGTTLSFDIFDPNNLRADLMVDFPQILGRPDLDLLLGVRDLNEDNFVVAGARYKR